MKSLLLFLVLAFTFTACKKTDDVTPQKPADVVAGTYKLSSFRLVQGTQSVSLPNSNVKLDGTALVKKSTSDDRITLTVDINGTNLFKDIEMEVRKTGNAYGLFDGNDQYADIDGKNITFNLSGTNDNNEKIEVAFVGQK